MGLAGCNFFPRVILHTFFSILLIYGGLGVGFFGLWSWIGLLGLGFLADWVGPCGVGPSVVLSGRGSLYKHRGITLGKTLWLAEA